MGVKFTIEQQYHNLIRNIIPLLESMQLGFTYDPGHSDLDNEQPIQVRMTLGDYRRVTNLLHEVKKV